MLLFNSKALIYAVI